MIVQNGGEFAQARTEGNLAIPIGSRLGRERNAICLSMTLSLSMPRTQIQTLRVTSGKT